MSHRIPAQSNLDDTASLALTCPDWCVAPHGMHDGEEDWVHVSEPLPLADRVLARLCMTMDPRTQLVDGPYVLIGAHEYTPAEAKQIGLALQALAVAAEESTVLVSA